jgi:hypothetical protein
LVFLTGAADAIAEETSEGIGAAGTEHGAEDVGGSHGMWKDLNIDDKKRKTVSA